jgi:hypothetical protein
MLSDARWVAEQRGFIKAFLGGTYDEATKLLKTALKSSPATSCIRTTPHIAELVRKSPSRQLEAKPVVQAEDGTSEGMWRGLAATKAANALIESAPKGRPNTTDEKLGNRHR